MSDGQRRDAALSGAAEEADTGGYTVRQRGWQGRARDSLIRDSFYGRGRKSDFPVNR